MASRSLSQALLIAAISWAFAWGLPVRAQSLDGCGPFQPIAEARAAAPSSRKVSDWADFQLKLWDAIQVSAFLAFHSYMQGEPSIAMIDRCVKQQEDRDSLNAALPAAFFDQTLVSLREMNLPLVNRFLERVEVEKAAGKLVLFRLVGESREAIAPTPGKAGFHRGSGSVFANLSRIQPTEWPIIFIHELTHAMDPAIAEGTRDYFDRELVDRVKQIASSKSSPSDLNEEEKLALARWLTAGLNRGLLAEYRAWAVTLAVYDEVKTASAVSSIGWLDSIILTRPTGTSFPAHVMRYLAPQFRNPDEQGIFASPLVRTELENLRDFLVTHPEQAPLGIAEAIFPRSSQ